MLKSLPRRSRVMFGMVAASYMWLNLNKFKNEKFRRTWLAQSEEHVTLDLGVMSSSPTCSCLLILPSGSF